MKPHRKRIFLKGFTLIEMLVAAVLLMVIIFLLATIGGRTTSIWRRADSQVNSFQSARFAFERMTRSISQASLNPYWDYLDASSNRRTAANAASFIPVAYGRCSDQHFTITNTPSPYACFFQAPLGYSSGTDLAPLGDLLNAVGYFVEFNDDAAEETLSPRPVALLSGSRWRYRLMELLQPSEDLDVYGNSDGTWITNALGPGRLARPIAENVIVGIFRALDESGNSLPAGGATFVYDSRDRGAPATLHQLPAQVEIILVVIDEAAAVKLAATYGNTPPPLVNSGYFLRPDQLEDDIEKLRADLIENPARPEFRILRHTVRLESAKWSED